LGEDKVNRISYTKRYDIDSHGRPKNPIGRTGITGRGHLGIKKFLIILRKILSFFCSLLRSLGSKSCWRSYCYKVMLFFFK
jgi:hypothetical protein